MDSFAPAPLRERDAWTGTCKAGAVDPDAPLYTIGRLAAEFGVTLRALRFYEDLGLLLPQRSGAARLYSQSDRDRIALILQGKKLGFTLREIGDLLASPPDEGDRGSLQLSRQQCVEQINLLERQKRTIENALTELRRTYSSQYLRELATREGMGAAGVDLRHAPAAGPERQYSEPPVG
jgi:DNA-binding transcriptional MerR regulator